MAREKDTRKILSGVQRLESGTLKTYMPGEEDELEAAMSPGEHATLVKAGAIAGDWHPGGEPPPVQAGSKAAKDAGLDAKVLAETAKKLDAAAVEKAKPKATAVPVAPAKPAEHAHADKAHPKDK